MRRLIDILLLGVVLAALPALAADGQFYFVGKVVPNSTTGSPQVYLRWDEVEGQLPADIAAFRLLRNGERVDPAADWSVDAIMSSTEIAALYSGADQQRIKLETITRLSEIASDSGIAFSANNFAQTIHDLINPGSADTYNPLWAFLGSRTDFNIARARYRAWIDGNPQTAGGGLSVTQYELLGVTDSGSTVRLGYVEIDPTSTQQALGATDLKQIRWSDWRCDLPESSKDHYTVMLHWESAGIDSPADRAAAQSYISGYDLYRTTENLALDVNDAPPRDIAALAAASQFDERGRPQIDGLEKVNVAVIMDEGAPSYDPDWFAAWQMHIQAGTDIPAVAYEDRPRQAKWLEARDQLQRAGLSPGDRRAYYLVPRDFTGGYGPTVGEVVEVPLMTRPPAPWNLRPFADETSDVLLAQADAMTFTWDEVDLDNYIKQHEGTRLFCNTLEAASTGVLEFVPGGLSCASTVRNAARLDVTDYRVYRFTDFDVAGRFKDSDGDGVEDSAEIPDFDANRRTDAFERSLGLQCNPSASPPDADNYLVFSKEGGSVSLGRDKPFNPAPPNRVRLRDIVPADQANKDGVYWYRVASEAQLMPSDVDDPNATVFVGRLSHLGAPQRALFPDREAPPPPLVSVTRNGDDIIGCGLEADPAASWSFKELVSDDADIEGTRFTLSCASGSFLASEVETAGEGACPQIAAACSGATNVTINFPATNNTEAKGCRALVPDTIDFCESGGLKLKPTFNQVDAAAGDLAFWGATVSVQPPTGDTCIAFFENIDGTATRIGSTCDPGGLTYTPRPGLFCGYAVATDSNNNVSTVVQFPCTLWAEQPKPPGPPQILTLDVDDSRARFTFRLPAEQVAVALARLDHEPGDGQSSRVIESIAVIDNQAGESVSFSLPVEPLAAVRDRFCLSLMSVGRDNGRGDAANSGWSTERCFTRTESGEDTPQYLPWPTVMGAEEGEPLQAALVSDYYQHMPFLAIELFESADIVADGSEFSHCWVDAPDVAPQYRQDFYPYRCFDGGLARVRTLLEPELRFVLYRQRRAAGGGAASDWVQVSPMIDYVHFDREVFQLNDRNITVWTLNDPFFRASLDRKNPTLLNVWFVDQYPFVRGVDAEGAFQYEWRYQAVYFDRENRPVRWRGSEWFQAGSF